MADKKVATDPTKLHLVATQQEGLSTKVNGTDLNAVQLSFFYIEIEFIMCSKECDLWTSKL
jgi:hypothetical protein